MTPALFLDRDGVVIENQPAYVRDWADVDIFPQAIRALKRLAALPIPIILVTNQSVIGRGLISRSQGEAINRELKQHIENSGGRIDGIMMCPHAPEENCSCRKPQPGLLLEAAEIYGIDLKISHLIGDAVTDLQAGYAAGIPNLTLLRTGRGLKQALLASKEFRPPYSLFDDLEQAVSAQFFEK